MVDEEKKERRGKHGLIRIWIGQRPTRLRGEEVAETVRKINIEATVGGDLDILPLLLLQSQRVFLFSCSCLTLVTLKQAKQANKTSSKVSWHCICYALFFLHAMICDLMLGDRLLVPTHIHVFSMYSHRLRTSYEHVLMSSRSTSQLQRRELQ